MIDKYTPDPVTDLSRFAELLKSRTPFCFVRFSDGEIEVLRNRYLKIGGGTTVFRGRTFGNQFPDFDAKRFDPDQQVELRRDLLEAAMMRAPNFFKGVPTKHNRALLDREFLLRLNGGMTRYLTFSDLFLNSNYPTFRALLVPLFEKAENLCVIANYRAKLTGALSEAKHIAVGDNFFESYEHTLHQVMSEALELPQGTLVLSSASSLSNVVGMRLFGQRPDLSFLDIGTTLNDLLEMDSRTRAYHQLYTTSGQGFSLSGLRYRFSREYQIEW